jgi:hypothetical protein
VYVYVFVEQRLLEGGTYTGAGGKVDDYFGFLGTDDLRKACAVANVGLMEHEGAVLANGREVGALQLGRVEVVEVVDDGQTVS